jgi:hypothetical protein
MKRLTSPDRSIGSFLGVEAVSNGVSAFREPTVKHAHRTLTAIVVILAVLLDGIAYLSRAYGIEAMDQTRSSE